MAVGLLAGTMAADDTRPVALRALRAAKAVNALYEKYVCHTAARAAAQGRH